MIDELNKHLPLELSAHLRYNGHAQILSIRGYSKLAARYKAAAEEELGHANAVIERLQQLGGFPAYGSCSNLVIPMKKWDLKQMLKSDLNTEELVLASLSDLAEMAEDEQRDFQTFHVVQHLIEDTEEDITWYRTQLAQIEELGLANYMQAQL